MLERVNPFIKIYRECNNGDNQSKFELIKQGKVVLPRYIDVELTNCCNFKCHFCPTGTRSMKRSKGYMQDDVVEKIVCNVKKYKIPGVRFIRWGEPTMHPKYIEIMENVKAAGAFIHINTNGSLIDKEQINKLMAIKLDSIKFSFQGADEGTYNEMRAGGDYFKLLNIVKTFNEIRGDKSYPYIQISTTLTGETIEQIDNFKNDVKGICDYYNIGYTKLNHLNVEKMDIDDREKEKILELQRREKNSHKYNVVCAEAFDKLSINWNGDVTLCCSDYDNFMILGNILDMDLYEIFNSKKANVYREIITRGEYSKIPCCSTCYEVIPVHK